MKKIGKPHKKALKAVWCVLLFTIFPLFASAQEPSELKTTPPVVNVAAVVKPRHIQFGEKAQLELTISGDTFIKHIKAPKFNFLPAFLAVPLHSDTVPRLKSDQIAVSMAWVYELIPQAIGDFSLSDIQFDYQGNFYFANPGSIRVSGADTYQDALTGSVHQVEVKVDTSKPYLNSPLTYTFRYRYTAVLPTRESPIPQLPEFRDFFVKEPTKLPLYTQQIRGTTYWVEERTRKLYPRKTGQIMISSAELLLPLPQGHKTLKTAPLTLTVQPIPEMGRPAHFNGAIGEYQISAQLERGWVEVGSALTLTVRISGHGNIQTVTAPKLPTIPGVMVSDPNRGRAGTFGITPTSRAYAYTLTPVRAGTVRIPSIGYAYFDPIRAVYATTQTDPIPLSVRPNPNDPAYIETEDPSWKFWVILTLAILLVGVLIAGFIWYRGGFANPFASIAPRAATRAEGVLDNGEMHPETPVSQAHTVLAELVHNVPANEATPFANALAQILYQYLEDTLTLSQRNIDAAREVCLQAEVSEHTREELVDILTKCDYHRFAPVPISTDEQKKLIARAEAVINNIENLQNAHRK